MLTTAFVCVSLFPLSAASASRDDALEYLAHGADAYRMGDIVQATQDWTRVIEFCRITDDRDLKIEALGRRGEALQNLGHVDSAIVDLSAALVEAEDQGDPRRVAAVSGALGNAYFQAHKLDRAGPLLQTSLRLARDRKTPDILAASANNWGNFLVSQRRDDEAIAAYGEAIDAVASEANLALQSTALTNRARVEVRHQRFPEAERDLARALQQLLRLPDARDVALALIAAGRVAMDLPAASSTDSQKLSYESFGAAAATGERFGDARTQSLALGYLGEVYERAGRHDDALVLTDRAIFLGQRTGNDNDLLYRWQWQRGRLLRAGGDIPSAIIAYREAVADLQAIRQDVPIDYTNGQSSFRQTLGPLFFQLADLLLQQTRVTPPGPARRKFLIDAQEVVESLKTAEIKDYFHDACLGLPQPKQAFITRLEPHTAALYPIVLPDRLELLLSLPDDLVQVTVPIDQDHLTFEVRLLRALLEKRITNEFIVQARKIYDWVIRPIENQLRDAKIDTIVFIPDGALRTIPVAALFDGEHFVIENYAVATAPGLSLVEAKSTTSASERRTLRAGLTVSVQDFAALPAVAAELDAIGKLANGDVLVDDQFRSAEFKRRLEQIPYSSVHIASHGVFTNDSTTSFILTYDGKINLDELEHDVKVASLRDRPLDLLTLSACETAAGDDRAALGMAGVAIKAGAETAVATLWRINDAAAAGIMPEFYRNLNVPGLTKAKAMQQAQRVLLADNRFRHPSYWAAFLVIGNWR